MLRWRTHIAEKNSVAEITLFGYLQGWTIQNPYGII